MGAWHLSIHLGEHDSGVVDCRSRDISPNTQTAVTKSVRRRNLNQSDIDRKSTRLEKPRNFRKKQGRVIDTIKVNRMAQLGTDKQIVDAKSLPVFHSKMGRLAFQMQMHKFQISKF